MYAAMGMYAAVGMSAAVKAFARQNSVLMLEIAEQQLQKR